MTWITLSVVVLTVLAALQLSVSITQSKRISVAHERMDAISERADLLSLRLDQLTRVTPVEDLIDWPGKEKKDA